MTFVHSRVFELEILQGRLGSLGTIPDKYDVAISTACSALNNLVVDTVEQGQGCIEYLRKQNVGRASFFVLEKLPADDRLEKIPTPENVPRLFDLIKLKHPRFAPAFYKGLGNTLVADDIDQANRIAYGQQKRWRVVTLAGQLFDTSGTMSGGGAKVARGGMSSKLASDAVQPAVMKQYEVDSGNLQAELEEILVERRKLEIELEGLQKQLPKVEMAAQKLDLDIHTADKRMQEDERRIKELSYASLSP
jgi:structural maintenance of chromosome 4